MSSYFCQVLFLSLFLLRSESLTCNDYQGCANNEYSVTNANCHGRQSCQNSDITATGSILCHGHQGCKGADLRGDDITCNGHYGCHTATIVSSGINNMIHCDGAHGCRDADITMSTTGTNYIIIRNNGLWSHLGGTFRFSDGMSARSYYYSGGFESSKNANVYSGENNEYVYMYLYGYRSGQSTSFYCQKGSTCILRCGPGACVNTNFYCDENATACSWSCDDNDYCSVNYEGQARRLVDRLNTERRLEELDMPPLEIDENDNNDTPPLEIDE